MAVIPSPNGEERADLRVVADEISLGLADSRSLFAIALAEVLDAQAGLTVVVSVSGNERHVVDTLTAHRLDVVVLGTGVRVPQAVALATALRERMPELAIVFLADEIDATLVDFVLDTSRSALLLTDDHPAEIARGLMHVIRGRTLLPSGWQHVRADVNADSVRALSPRQLEVLELLAVGHSYDEIAQQLYISVNTVKFHVRSIFSILGVHNRTAAARLLGGGDRPGTPAH